MIVTEEHIALIVRRAKEYGAKQLILFGSALETPENANDIDLAADIPGLELFSFANVIEDELQCPIDIVSLRVQHPFIDYVVKNGKRLI